MPQGGAQLLLLIIALLLTGCQKRPPTLHLAAAASLQPVLEQLAPEIESRFHVRLQLNTAASGILSRQILQGGPADLFISANKQWMDQLQTRGRLAAGTRIDLLSNHLIVVARGDLSDPPQKLSDLTSPRFRPLAMGDPAYVPAGQYARQALQHAHLWSRIQDHATAAGDVQAALAYVIQGECPVGIVYASDIVGVSKVRKLFEVPSRLYPPIVYPAAVIEGSGMSQQAKAVLKWLVGPQARATFQTAGFQVQ